LDVHLDVQMVAHVEVQQFDAPTWLDLI
jgi:hypothetical protein